MPRPCSHRYEKYSILLDKPLSFKDGIVYWHIANCGKDFGYYELEHIISKSFETLNYHFNPYGVYFKQAKSISEAFIKVYFTGYRTGFWSDLITGLFPKFRKFFVIEPFIMDSETLAYAFHYGSGKYQGHCYFNDQYDWKHGEYALEKVFIHETLHIANVGHTLYLDDIMNPDYDSNSFFTEDCKSAIAFLYDKPKI